MFSHKTGFPSVRVYKFKARRQAYNFCNYFGAQMLQGLSASGHYIVIVF